MQNNPTINENNRCPLFFVNCSKSSFNPVLVKCKYPTPLAAEQVFHAIPLPLLGADLLSSNSAGGGIALSSYSASAAGGGMVFSSYSASAAGGGIAPSIYSASDFPI